MSFAAEPGTGPANEPTGRYSGYFGFPDEFFASRIPRESLARAADAQYLSLRKLHNGIVPYDFCRIEYEASAYGMTTPSGIKLGDAAFPGLNGGHPRWEVMAHEQGHNFFGGTSPFYIALATPYPFLQESLAVLSAFYTYHDLSENAAASGLEPEVLDSLEYDFANGRRYQEAMFERYVQEGRNFNIREVLTSQALDYKMIVLGERYGWDNFQRLTKAFDPSMDRRFTFQRDGASAEEQSTYIVAALSAAFEQDLRHEFMELGFPIDDDLYREVYGEILDQIATSRKSMMKPSQKVFLVPDGFISPALPDVSKAIISGVTPPAPTPCPPITNCLGREFGGPAGFQMCLPNLHMMTCQSTGQWSNGGSSDSTCQRLCKDSGGGGGHCTPITNCLGNTLSDLGTKMCLKDLHLRICQADGKWSDEGVNGTCQRLCHAPPASLPPESQKPDTHPAPPENRPVTGRLDSVSPTIAGWAEDPDEPDKSIRVQLYYDGTAGSCVGDCFFEEVATYAPPQRQVNFIKIGSTTAFAHVFYHEIPEGLKDGKTHAIRAYGIDTADAAYNRELEGSPRTFTVAGGVGGGGGNNVPGPLGWRWIEPADKTLSADVSRLEGDSSVDVTRVDILVNNRKVGSATGNGGGHWTYDFNARLYGGRSIKLCALVFDAGGESVRDTIRVDVADIFIPNASTTQASDADSSPEGSAEIRSSDSSLRLSPQMAAKSKAEREAAAAVQSASGATCSLARPVSARAEARRNAGSASRDSKESRSRSP